MYHYWNIYYLFTNSIYITNIPDYKNKTYTIDSFKAKNNTNNKKNPSQQFYWDSSIEWHSLHHAEAHLDLNSLLLSDSIRIFTNIQQQQKKACYWHWGDKQNIRNESCACNGNRAVSHMLELSSLYHRNESGYFSQDPNKLLTREQSSDHALLINVQNGPLLKWRMDRIQRKWC